MFVVLQVEKHPDAFVKTCFGPFATNDAAAAFANDHALKPKNFNGSHQLFSFNVRELANGAP